MVRGEAAIHLITHQKKKKGNLNLLSTRCAVEKTQFKPQDLKWHHNPVTGAQALFETVLLWWTVILCALSLPSCSGRVKLNVLFKPSKISHFEHNKKG